MLSKQILSAYSHVSGAEEPQQRQQIASVPPSPQATTGHDIRILGTETATSAHPLRNVAEPPPPSPHAGVVYHEQAPPWPANKTNETLLPTLLQSHLSPLMTQARVSSTTLSSASDIQPRDAAENANDRHFGSVNNVRIIPKQPLLPDWDGGFEFQSSTCACSLRITWQPGNCRRPCSGHACSNCGQRAYCPLQ